LPELNSPYAIVITGVGGTGIVTLSAILGVAAHLDGKGINVLDMTGLAQKFGAVSSHVQIAEHGEDLNAARIAAGHANLLLGCDAITASSDETLAKLDHQHTRAVVNEHATITSDYLQNADMPFPEHDIKSLISDSVCPEQAWFFDSTRIAEKACGNPIASNMLMIGYAWQKGLIPLSGKAIEQAIKINQVAVEMNLQAFNWGRCLASDRQKVIESLGLAQATEPSLNEIIAHRCKLLTTYQNQHLADKYTARIEKLRTCELSITDTNQLSLIAAQQYARLLLIKDEYEIARLLSSNEFKAELDEQFESGYAINYHLAPPLLSRSKYNAKNPSKIKFGPWLTPLLKLMVHAKTIRNTWFDPFRYTAERRTDLALLSAYEQLIDNVTETLQSGNHAALLEMAELAEQIKGFGHGRVTKAEEVMAKWTA
jgi:indolepyruvate ferredoxin oxidoreductase